MGRDTRETEQGRGASEWNVPKRPLEASGIKAVGRRKGDRGSPLLFRWRNRVDPQTFMRTPAVGHPQPSAL